MNDRFRAPRTKKDLVLRSARMREGKPCTKCGGVWKYISCGNCVSCMKAKYEMDATRQGRLRQILVKREKL